MATITGISAFIDTLDEVTLNSSSVLLTLQDLAFLHYHGNVEVLRTVFADG
jgi:hypothetical protein